MPEPLVSIIIPTYNRGHLIGETLDSVIAQTYCNWECIVVDDGSIDETTSIMRKYCKKDARIKYYQRPKTRPKGANACRNYGFELSNGEYVNWFDSDDLMNDKKIEIQLNDISSNNYAFSVTQTKLFDYENENLGMRSKKMRSENLIQDFINYKVFWLFSSVLWSKTFLIKYQLKHNENLQQAQDYYFNLLALKLFPNYITNDYIGTFMLIHDGNMSKSSVDTPEKIKSNAFVNIEIMKGFRIYIDKYTEEIIFRRLILFYREAVRRKQKGIVIYIFLNFMCLLKDSQLKFKLKLFLKIVKALLYPFTGYGFKYTKLEYVNK